MGRQVQLQAVDFGREWLPSRRRLPVGGRGARVRLGRLLERGKGAHLSQQQSELTARRGLTTRAVSLAAHPAHVCAYLLSFEVMGMGV